MKKLASKMTEKIPIESKDLLKTDALISDFQVEINSPLIHFDCL